MAGVLVALALTIGLAINVVAQCSFSDTFNSFPSDPASSPSFSPPAQPRGAALEYAGFSYYGTSATNLTTTTTGILTNAHVQSLTSDQPTFLRSADVNNFDLFSLQFACAYATPSLRTALFFPSCLISVVCQPMSVSPTIPNGHRVVKQPMVQQYFKFVGNNNASAKQDSEDLFLKSDTYQTATFSAGFDNLDYCYLMIEQTSAILPLGQSAVGLASLLINSVEGVARGFNCSTN